MKYNRIVKFIHLFASIYINPVVYSLLIKVAWGAFVWVAYINLLISGAKVKGRNYFTKISSSKNIITLKTKACVTGIWGFQFIYYESLSSTWYFLNWK
jgi:hypothetical protein